MNGKETMMAGKVDVTVSGTVVHAKYVGKMTMELVQEGEQKIQAALARTLAPVILYDCVQMEPPEMSLALEMKAFDGRIRHLVRRAATVVRDPTTAFAAKVAFVLARNHKVFYQDIQAALRWLSETAAERNSPSTAAS